MQFVTFFMARHDTGALLPSGFCYVYQTGTSTLASIYNSSGGSISNPAVADTNALVGFEAPNGTYDLQFKSSDGTYTSPKLVGFQIFDLVALGTSAGPGLIGFSPATIYAAGTLGAWVNLGSTAIADANIAAGQLVNLTVTGGVPHMSLADGSNPAKPAHAFCTVGASSGASGNWTRRGLIPGTSGTSFASGLWLSDATPGGYSSTAPTTAGHISQYIGMVLPGLGVEFSPQLEIDL